MKEKISPVRVILKHSHRETPQWSGEVCRTHGQFDAICTYFAKSFRELQYLALAFSCLSRYKPINIFTFIQGSFDDWQVSFDEIHV